MEWGRAGGEETALGATFAVVVDVLSFTTTLSVAMDQGATVYPYRWKDDSAADYAHAHDAKLADSSACVRLLVDGRFVDIKGECS
ncbi:hypothetical protein [Phytoactinopolyspora endophytica]|uniref:hypothetical protein n=1 Tax=Phytoactinopolyspora endophytica TaxID=1642495 RepID=UPI00197BEFC6|nr:hypothetical protein [Phytoactinopolyspora endophytica]